MTGTMVVGLCGLGFRSWLWRSTRAALLGFALLLGAWWVADCGNIDDDGRSVPEQPMAWRGAQ